MSPTQYGPACSSPRGARRRSPGAARLSCLLAAAALNAAVAAQSQWTDLGCALPGTGGAPALTGTGTLVDGTLTTVELDEALPSSPALLFLSLSDNPTPFKGGTVKPVPFFDLPLLTTSPTGEIDLPFPWPAGVPESTPLYLQYAVQDSGAILGVALSNALRGVTPGPAIIDALSATAVASGDLLTIDGVNLGSSENDICILLHDERGAIAAFTRAQSVSGNSVTTEVGGIVPGNLSGKLSVNVGSGSVVPASGLPAGVSSPGTWVFQGDPADMTTFDQDIALGPSGSGSSFSGSPPFLQFRYSQPTDGSSLELRLPPGPYPPGTRIFLQIDANPPGFDAFVELDNATTLSALDAATTLCNLLEPAVFGSTGLDIDCVAAGGGPLANISIFPAPGDTWAIGSDATFWIEYQTSGCDNVGGSSTGGAFDATMPLVIPDGAGVGVCAQGYTDLGSNGYFYDAFVLPPGPITPLALATDVCASIQAALNGQGLLVTCSAALVGSDVVIQVSEPVGEVFTGASLYVQICDLL